MQPMRFSFGIRLSIGDQKNRYFEPLYTHFLRVVNTTRRKTPKPPQLSSQRSRRNSHLTLSQFLSRVSN